MVSHEPRRAQSQPDSSHEAWLDNLFDLALRRDTGGNAERKAAAAEMRRLGIKVPRMRFGPDEW